MPPAATQQGINHRAAFAGFGMPNEQPILLSRCAGLNRILNSIRKREIGFASFGLIFRIEE